MEEIATDYTSIYNKVNRLKDLPDFPQPDDYGVTREAIHDYLLDKEEVKSQSGSLKSQYTIKGLLLILPVLVLSVFDKKSLPWGDYAIFLGILCRIVLFLIYTSAIKAIVRKKFATLYDEKIEKYIADVMAYNQEIK